ncbi:MAG: hypothetical protein Q8N17_13675 [Burkholderiaceae bacterium]|nr:hypothetical protein [Desulfobacterales bacterium]MDP3137365.1 hypothetical protein [Burkholderiaceae bacterium]
MKRSTVLCALAITVLSTGCASITGSEMQQLALSAKSAGNPAIEGAKCRLSNDKGAWEAITPSFVNIRRSAEDLNVECKKDGEPDGFLKAVSRAAGSMYGNIVFGGGIGALIDHSKGTGYNYPDLLPVEMGKSGITDRRDQNTAASK